MVKSPFLRNCMPRFLLSRSWMTHSVSTRIYRTRNTASHSFIHRGEMLRIQPNPVASRHRVEQNVYVPLKSVDVDTKIRSFAADVRITQVFRNDENNPIEAVYCFPIEERAAVYSFTARIDDREIVAQLKEKKQAQREYSDALQQGHGAYLLEQDEKSQDNFIINVGALPAGKECTIVTAYVTELELFQGSTIRFVIPTTIAPRYNSGQKGIAGPAGTTSKYVQSSPYTIGFRCQIEKVGRSQDECIARINSSSHPIQVDFSQADAYVVTFAQENTHLDRDILLNIELAGQRANTILAVESGAVMVAFTPKEEDCRGGDQENEFIFVIDCSGSMSDENKIGLARQAMSLFLKSLPLNCHFNIVRFGSSHQSLFSEVTSLYNEQNAKQAEQLIKTMDADLGGTEVLRPLQWVKDNRPREGRARQIFLLTDGEISDVTEVLDLCRSMASSTRIFSFGLGQSPSRSLVKGLARATNGRFVFIPPNAKVDTYVGEQLQKALHPCLSNVQVQWNVGVDVRSAPRECPPVYVNDRLIVYALINDPSKAFDHTSSVELRSGDRLLGVAKIDRIPNVAENQTIARLAAKALILELQHEKTPSARRGSTQTRFQGLNNPNEEKDQATSDQQRIIDLSLKYQILSPHTAFVGIEKRTNSSNDQMVLREVPIEVSSDDQHLIRASVQSSRAANSYRSMNMAMSSPSMSGYRGGFLVSNAMHHHQMLSSDSYSTRDCSRVSYPMKRCRAASPAELSDGMLDMSMPAATSSSRKSSVQMSKPQVASSFTKDVQPSGDEDLVRSLIDKQRFDGLWDADDTIIQALTGKPLASWKSVHPDIDPSLLASLIIILVLEQRFATHSSLWYGIVQKARKAIRKLLSQDAKNIDTYIERIRPQL